MIKKILSLCLLIISIQLFASNIQIESYVDRTNIGIMDRLQLTIEISGSKANKISAPNLPNIDNFKNLGYSTSSSSSYSFVNGKAESTVTKKFIYSLKPLRKGSHLIPPLQIKFDGKTYTTDPITINVTDGSTQSVPSSIRSSSRENNTSSRVSDNLFLEATINKNTVYEGEPIIVEYVLYTRYDVSNLSFGEESNFQGFWKENLYTPNEVDFSSTTRNGMRFKTMLMQRVALYPNETGNLQIPTLNINVDILTQPRSFFDFGSTKSFELTSKPKKIKVLPLPEAPENFSGAIGKFKLNSKISNDELKVGDSFTYTLEITGSGNFKHFELPKLPNVKHLRFLDPEIETEISKNNTTGKKTIKYLVIAQEQGNIEIPSLDFCYFDTNSKSYKTLSTSTYHLKVGAGNLAYIPSSAAQTAVTLEGSDIGFLSEISSLKSDKIYFQTWSYWLILILMFLSIPISYFYKQEQEKLESNDQYSRNKRAIKILKKYMKEATSFANEGKEEFYAAAQTGLSNYLSDKLHIARGSTTDDILTNLKSKNISEHLLTEIKEIFEICNRARFMPGGFSNENIKEHHEMIKKLVNDLSKIKM